MRSEGAVLLQSVTQKLTAQIPAEPLAPDSDPNLPGSARVWSYWLGGQDNYAVDREVGERYRAAYPQISAIASESRAFQSRAVQYLAAETRTRQFLEIGVGYPVGDSTHEIAQQIAPESKTVYVDSNREVMCHARALLTGGSRGTIGYVEADLRQPEQIMEKAAGTLDLDHPVAILLLRILGHIKDDEEARSIVSRLLARVPSGSYLVISDGTNVINRTKLGEVVAEWGKVRSSRPGRCLAMADDDAAPVVLRGEDRLTLALVGALEQPIDQVAVEPAYEVGVALRQLVERAVAQHDDAVLCACWLVAAAA